MKLKKLVSIRKLSLVTMVLAMLAALVLPLLPEVVRAAPADCYWVGGNGDWTDDDNHWAVASGGAPADGNVPDSSSNVHFDASSDSGAGFAVSFNSTAYCADMDWSTVDQIPTINGVATLNIYGSLVLVATMVNNYTGSFYFKSTGAETITMSGVSFPTSGSPIYFDGAGGSWVLQDTFTLSGAKDLKLKNGTLNTNGQTVNCDGISGEAGTNALTLGVSTVNCGGFDATLIDAVTANTSTISISSTASLFYGNGYTYYDLIMAVSSTTGYLYLAGANTFNDVTVTGTADDPILDYNYFDIAGNQTINGTLAVSGNNGQNRRLIIKSSALHTQRTITAAVVSFSNVDFRDIAGAGAASWDLSAITGGSGDCGGNSGITFTTAKTVYHVAGIGSYNWTANHWALTSGGAAALSAYPIPQDTAVFDANSMLVAGAIITINESQLPAINTTNVTNNPTFTSASAYFYGSVKLGTNTWTVTNSYFYSDSLDLEFETSGQLTGALTFDMSQNGRVTLSGDAQTSTGVTLLSGILDLNDYDLTCSTFTSSTTTQNRVITMGSGYLTLNSAAAVTKWNVASLNLTVIPETSTIAFTSTGVNAGTFAGAGLTYNNFTIEGTGNYTTTITGANTFNTITIDRSGAAKTISGAVTCTVSDLVIPIASATVVTITNTDFSKASGTVCSDYLTISGSSAAGGASFYAGANSTNSGGNAGWSFTGCTLPTVTTLSASGITSTTATLRGNLTSLGSFTSGVYISFDYGLTTAYELGSTTETAYTTTGIKTAPLGSLTDGVTYHYRVAVRYNVSSYVRGSDFEFVAQDSTSEQPPYSGTIGGCTYTSTITISETNGTSYTMLPILVTANNSWMAANGFMLASALDTKVQTIGGTLQSHLVVTNQTALATAIVGGTQTILLFGSGCTPATSMHILTGYGGYITTLDDAALEPGANFSLEVSGYLNMAIAGNIIYKDSAITLASDGAGTLTVTMTGVVATSITPVVSGAHVVTISSDGVNLMLQLDGDATWDGTNSSRAATAGAPVAGNANNWILMSNAIPYMDYYTHTVGGTLIVEYEPVYMINVDILPDLEGVAQNGTITWGANPAGIAVTISSMTSSAQPIIGGGGDTSTSDLLPSAGDSDWNTEPAVTGALLTNPLRPIVVAVSDNTTLSERQVWVLFGLITVVFITVLVGANVRGHHLITGIASGLAMVLMIVWTIFPIWAVIVVIMAVAGGLISERSPSL